MQFARSSILLHINKDLGVVNVPEFPPAGARPEIRLVETWQKNAMSRFLCGLSILLKPAIFADRLSKPVLADGENIDLCSN